MKFTAIYLHTDSGSCQIKLFKCAVKYVYLVDFCRQPFMCVIFYSLVYESIWKFNHFGFNRYLWWDID